MGQEEICKVLKNKKDRLTTAEIAEELKQNKCAVSRAIEILLRDKTLSSDIPTKEEIERIRKKYPYSVMRGMYKLKVFFILENKKKKK